MGTGEVVTTAVQDPEASKGRPRNNGSRVGCIVQDPHWNGPVDSGHRKDADNSGEDFKRLSGTLRSL